MKVKANRLIGRKLVVKNVALFVFFLFFMYIYKMKNKDNGLNHSYKRKKTFEQMYKIFNVR